ncbi:MAG: ABC transporter substrate-binding protein [Deltaproteobacteria bacterium]|nr:ABC transporter substrate-binding protein [Deltaproteobacteria bacterium]
MAIFTCLCLSILTAQVARAADMSDLSNTLIYAGENPETINPLLNIPAELPSLVFSGLMKYDYNKPVPDLAESYEYDDASLTYTFKLRKGVKFHDGKELTADDVVFTYETLTKDDTLASSVTSNYQDIASVSAVDPYTVKIVMSQFNAAMLDYFTIGICPKHILEGQNFNTTPFNQNPIGTGRYKFVEWDTAGNTIIVEKNADYYDKVPNIDRIVYKTVAVESTKALMLQAGEADLAWLNSKYAARFRGLEGFKNIDFKTADYRGASFDFHTDFWQKNKDSTGVLNYAINKKEIVEGVLVGEGLPAYSPIQLSTFGGNTKADIYPYDLARFSQEIEKLGWKKGADGIYERNGQKFSFSIQVRDYEEERVDIANVVSRMLQAVGVEMKINLVTRFDWKAGYNGFLAGMAAEFDPDQFYATLVTGASENTMAYSNPEIDDLMNKGRHAKDPNERKQIYAQFEEAYAKSPGTLLVAFLNGNYVSVAGLDGLDTGRVLGHHAVGVFWNVENWTLKR